MSSGRSFKDAIRKIDLGFEGGAFQDLSNDVAGAVPAAANVTNAAVPFVSAYDTLPPSSNTAETAKGEKRKATDAIKDDKAEKKAKVDDEGEDDRDEDDEGDDSEDHDSADMDDDDDDADTDSSD
jgi:hypothetical protein